MPRPSMDIARGWIGRSLLDGHGETAGRITDIYMDQDSGQAEWALVDTDRDEARSTFVPLPQTPGRPRPTHPYRVRTLAAYA